MLKHSALLGGIYVPRDNTAETQIHVELPKEDKHAPMAEKS